LRKSRLVFMGLKVGVMCFADTRVTFETNIRAGHASRNQPGV
jgi:hypothetical protein